MFKYNKVEAPGDTKSVVILMMQLNTSEKSWANMITEPIGKKLVE